ncbi:hypothetical protein JS61_05365 [Rickettsia felis]|nr:hypothetical protein JS61_05365 [Rickettsia felis]
MEQIYSHIVSLSKIKQGTPGNRTSTNPEVSKRRLDSLARLVTGDNICSAIRYYNDTILIASNSGGNELAKEVLDTVKDFSKDNRKNGKCLEDELLRLYVKSSWKPFIKQLINQQKEISTLKNSSEKRVKALYNNIEKLLSWPGIMKAPCNNKKKQTDYINELTKLFQGEQELNKFCDFCSECIKSAQNTKSFEKEHKIIGIIRHPLKDIKKVAADFIDPEMSKFSNKVKQAIIDGKIKYLNNQNSQKEKIHAEMRILQEIYQQNNNNLEILKNDLDSEYIGITKLCCLSCQVTIEALTGKELEESEIVRGNHGKAYEYWKAPDFVYKDEDLQKKILYVFDLLTKKDNKKYHKLGKDGADFSDSSVDSYALSDEDKAKLQKAASTLSQQGVTPIEGAGKNNQSRYIGNNKNKEKKVIER